MREPTTDIPPGCEDDRIYRYLEHLLATERFQHSPSLSHLLEYLVKQKLDHHTDEIKESIIAIDVFGRSPDFDGRADNIVRVQAHRLRKLLETHYAAQGAADEFHIIIPKGAYVPQMLGPADAARLERITPLQPLLAPLSASKQAAPPSIPSRLLSWPVAIAFAAGVLITVLVLVASGRLFPTASIAGTEDLRRAPLSALWGSVMQPGANCIVSFTNPAFLWRKTAGGRIYMSYLGPLSAPVGTQMDLSPNDPYLDPEALKPNSGPFFFSDSWTGTGEVLGIQKLTRLFAEAGHPLKAIRSRALTSNDMVASNVIFLGSPWANELQDKFNAGPAPLYCIGPERIVNREPRSGEPSSYEPEFHPQTKQLGVTYVLFSVLPGITPGTKIISSAGINTQGTYAGIDYLTSIEGVEELIHHFDPAHGKTLPNYFQTVIRTNIVHGEAVNPQIVLVRTLDSHAPSN